MGALAKASNLDACKYSAAAISTLGYSRHTGGHWTHGLNVRLFFNNLFCLDIAISLLYLKNAKRY
jgi:hypothetical protein